MVRIVNVVQVVGNERVVEPIPNSDLTTNLSRQRSWCPAISSWSNHV